MSVVAMLLLPLAAALVCCFPARRRVPEAATVVASVGVMALALWLGLRVAAHGRLVVVSQWIVVDGLSALVVLLVGIVGALATVFSVGYMGRDIYAGRRRVYYVNYNLFLFSVLSIPMLAEPTLVWIVVELTTVCSAMLVSLANTRSALEAAWKYVVLSLMGAATALLGFLLLFAAMRAGGGGAYTWDGLVAVAPRMPAVLLQAAFLLTLIGLGTKVGLVPMHTWLPDAYSQAPSPVCALLSGVETTAVFYVILRLLPVLKGASGAHVEIWTTVFGLVSVGTAVFLLLQVADYKRMFAFSTVEHMGIILMAAGWGNAASQYGALYQALCHSLTKAFCFFAAGTTILATGDTRIANVRGLIRTSPVAGVSLLIAGLGIAGAPPFALFLSEFSVFRAGLTQGRYISTGLLMLFVAVGFFGIMSRVNRMVFGPAPDNLAGAVRLPATCVAALCIAGFLLVWFGLYLPAPIYSLLRQGAAVLER